MAANEFQQLDHDPLQHLSEGTHAGLARHQSMSGCFSLVGPIQLCYSWDGSQMQVCLQVGGVKITCVEVSTAKPCAQLEGSVIFGKASIKICLENSCLTYDGTACYRLNPFGEWTCGSVKGTIVCF